MDELFDKEFECYTELGKNLNIDFGILVEDFINDKCNSFNTRDVETILKDVISQKCLFNRARKNLKKRINKVE